MTVVKLQGRGPAPVLTLTQADAIRDALCDSLAIIEDHRGDGSVHTHLFQPWEGGKMVPAWTHSRPVSPPSVLRLTRMGTKAEAMFAGECEACGAAFDAPRKVLRVEGDQKDGPMAKEACPQCGADVWLYPVRAR